MTVHYFQPEGMLPLHFKAVVKQVAREGMRFASHKKINPSVGVSFVSACEMQALNEQYKGKSKPTDVLAFPGSNADGGFLGDVIVCPEVAKRQADELGHSLLREIAFLCCHGLLHLLGYEHANQADEEKMTKAQEEILARVGVPR